MLRFVQTLRTLVLILALLAQPDAFPCTTLLLPQSPGLIVATNMDWPSPQGLILINKRDVQKTSGFIPASQTPLTWTSKYVSLTFTQTGREFPWEGINEKGLSVNLLQLAKTELPIPNGLPAVNGMQWVQYILDTAANLTEAIADAQAVRVGGGFSNADHYFVCDATGSCATFEYIFGTLTIHNGSALSYPVLANSGYQTSLNNLQALLSNQNPTQILGSTSSDSLTRFAKAAILSSEYTPPQDPIAYGFSALNQVRQNITQWQMMFSLAQPGVQYRTAISPVVKSISLSQFDPNCSTPVMQFHVNSKLSGDVSSSLTAYTPADNDRLISSNADWTTSLVAAVENYPDLTQCMEPSTTVLSSENPANVGDPVTLKAIVAGKGSMPTGSVTFYNGTSLLGTVPLNAAGEASLNTSSLPVGTNLISASYAGDSANAAMSSFPLSQVVSPPTRTTVSTSANPSVVGQTVTFTATVSSAGGTIPAGAVTFSFGGTVAANVQLVNGQASFKRTLTIPGTRAVTATYSGDGVNPPSISQVLTEVVN